MVQTPSLLSRVAPFFFFDVVLKDALGRRCTLLVNGPIVGYRNGPARYGYIATTGTPSQYPEPPLTPLGSPPPLGSPRPLGGSDGPPSPWRADRGAASGPRRRAAQVEGGTRAIQGSYTGALPNLVVLRWLRRQPYLVDLRYIRRRDLLLVVRRAASRSGTVR
jgi:hypothetical protein